MAHAVCKVEKKTSIRMTTIVKQATHTQAHRVPMCRQEYTYRYLFPYTSHSGTFYPYMKFVKRNRDVLCFDSSIFIN